MSINSKCRSDLPAYNTLEIGAELSDCLHFPLESYCTVEKVNERNGFVCGKDELPKRVRIGYSYMQRLAGHLVETRPQWQALELLVFTFTCAYMVGVKNGEEIWVNRDVRVAARDWDEADRIYRYFKEQWLNCGLFSGWMNTYTSLAINKEN